MPPGVVERERARFDGDALRRRRVRLGRRRRSAASRTTTGCRVRGCSRSGTTPSAGSTTPTRCGATPATTSVSTCWASTSRSTTDTGTTREHVRRRPDGHAARRRAARPAAWRRRRVPRHPLRHGGALRPAAGAGAVDRRPRGRRAGPTAPQLPARVAAVTGPSPDDGTPQDEDCLRVDVRAPAAALADGVPRPVLVWLHGGAYVIGSAATSWYDTARLVAEGDVVTVNVGYRLGVLGWLAAPGVSDGNLGLLDQIAALRWVRDRIAAFGGDADAGHGDGPVRGRALDRLPHDRSRGPAAVPSRDPAERPARARPVVPAAGRPRRGVRRPRASRAPTRRPPRSGTCSPPSATR